MSERDLAIEQFLALNPALFDVLDTFQIRQTELPEQFQSGEPYEIAMIVEMVLRVLVDEYEDQRRLRLTFYGVDQLKMATGSLINGVEITIRSIKDQQWERLCYHVYEKENSQMGLSFYCRGFVAKLEGEQITRET
jgi:hypothetical protein